MRKTKRALALALSGALALALCWAALPKTARAAKASQVTLHDGTTPIVLSSVKTSHDFGSGRGRATFDPGEGILELFSVQVTGSGPVSTIDHMYSAVYAVGDLTIELDGANAIGMLPAEQTGNPYARALWVSGSLTVTGTGSLKVTGGNGYFTQSMVVSANSLTVNGGVTLEAVAGSPNAAATSSYNGIQVEQLINHGRITAVGYTHGIYCNRGMGSVFTSQTDGYLSATGRNGCGLLLGSLADFQVKGGVVELKGTGRPAVEPSQADNPVHFTIGSAITSGRMGSDSASAAAFSAQEIMNHYQAGSRSYAYLYLSAAADVPKTGDDAPLVLLCGLVLLSGAGLAASAVLRRRKEER